MLNYRDRTYILASNCMVVEGYSRNTLQDLQNLNYIFIPNSILGFLLQNENIHQHDIIEKLIDNQIIFEIDESDAKHFPKLSLEWDFYGDVTNAIIEIDSSSAFDIKYIINHLINLGCYHLQFYIDCNNKILETISTLTKDSILNCIEIFIDGNKTMVDNNSLINICNLNKKIKSILIFNSTENKIIQQNENNWGSITSLTSQKLNHGVDWNYFTSNIRLFSESQTFNIYFNRKLYISSAGEIKNAPETVLSFGNINDINSPIELKKIIQKADYQKYWYVKKDLIDVCKDCEFRYMCVDSRLPLQRDINSWYHEVECNYNPYICKWQGEEGYRTLQECGMRSDETGFYIDHDKIAAINRELWGDDE